MEPAIDNMDNETPDIIATISKPHKRYNIAIERMNEARKKKQRTINPTIRQKRAAKIMNDNVSQNLHKSSKDVLIEAGYDISTAEKPSLVLDTRGFKQELAQYGLTEELITSSLVEDIQAKPQKRVRELELGADILSMRKRPVEPNNIINIALFSTEQQNRIAQRIIENLAPNNAPNKDDTSIN